MKIAIISFDFFGFDSCIIEELNKRGVIASQIDISKFEYKYNSIFHRISNFLTKLFFRKNFKKIEMEKHILTQLQILGKQDIILSIRPDSISKKTHLEIKKWCNKYISYLYDSTNLYPIDNLLNEVFDKIYTFDKHDAKKYNFELISNYIYFEKRNNDPVLNYKYDLFVVSSVDERIDTLNKVARICEDAGLSFRFIVVGKKKPKNLHPKIIYTNKKMSFEDLKPELENAKVFLDIIKENQNGLSFRIFDALAFQKKIITSNASVKEYAFYNPNNFLIIDTKNIKIPLHFFSSTFEPLPEAIYQKFTINNWVSTVFEID